MNRRHGLVIVRELQAHADRLGQIGQLEIAFRRFAAHFPHEVDGAILGQLEGLDFRIFGPRENLNRVLAGIFTDQDAENVGLAALAAFAVTGTDGTVTFASADLHGNDGGAIQRQRQEDALPLGQVAELGGLAF